MRTSIRVALLFVTILGGLSSARKSIAQNVPPPFFSDMGARSASPQPNAQPSTPSRGVATLDAAAQATTSTGGQLISFVDTSYQISPQDVIEIRVFGQPNMDASSRVDARGTLTFPPVGQVQVADLTERQLEELLEQRLRSGGFLLDPHVSVFVREMHPREVAIIGEVKAPGRYPYFFGSRSIVELLAQAGGMTDKAGGQAYVLRFSNPLWTAGPSIPDPSQFDSAVETGAVQRLAVDLNDLLIGGRAEANLQLEPGDIVTIPDAGYVHVTGKGLENPGVYPLRRGVNTLSQFIDQAGGTKFEHSGTITLVRGAASGREGEVERVNLRKLLRRETAEIVLQQGDKIIVHRSAPKFVLASVGRGLAKIVNIGAYFNVSQN